METIGCNRTVVQAATQGPPPGGAQRVATDGCDRFRRIRVDAGGALALGRGSMLRTFGLGFRAAGRAAMPVPERRGEERHHHVECLAWVGWKRWRRFDMNDAVLINLSRGGARVFLDKAPPRGRPIWLYLETPGHKAVVRAEVRSLETTAQGQCSLRVEFSEPCPYALFEAAVCGLAPADPKMRLARPARSTPPRPMAVPAAGRRRRTSILFG